MGCGPGTTGITGDCGDCGDTAYGTAYGNGAAEFTVPWCGASGYGCPVGSDGICSCETGSCCGVCSGCGICQESVVPLLS